MAETTYKIDVPMEGSVTWTIKASSLKEALEKARDQVDYHYDEGRDVTWFYNHEALHANLASGDGVVADGESVPWREVRQVWDEEVAE